MDFELELAKEYGLEEFQKEVRDWLEANVPQDAVRAVYPEDFSHEEYLWRRELGRKLGEKGWLFPVYPKEYGGGGLTMNHAVVIELEMDKFDLSNIPFYNSGARIGAPCIMIWGTEEQKKTFLPPMLKGETLTWQLLTEPQGGSDLASTITRAVRDGDEYVVNGQKTFVGAAHEVDHMYTIVNTDPTAPRHQNLSWILIPANLPGIERQPLDLCTGQEGGGPKQTVFFDNVHVPAFNLIGGENNGWKVATTHLELEHAGAGSLESDHSLDEFFAYCKNTQFQGKPLSQDPEVRDLLADIRVEAHIRRLFGLRNFWMRHAKQPMSYEGSQAQFYRRMSTFRGSVKIQEILGYFALTKDPQWAPGGRGEIDKYVRHGFGGFHGGGTHDVDRVIIARRMGLGRTVKEEAGQTML